MMQIETPIPKPQMFCDEDDDLNALCRLCAHASELLVPIYEGEGLKAQLADKIASYLPIQVRQTDTLPIHLCYQCASLVLSWHELVTGCVQAEHHLRKLLKTQINGGSKNHIAGKYKELAMSVETNVDVVEEDRPGPAAHQKEPIHTAEGGAPKPLEPESGNTQRAPSEPERTEEASPESLKETCVKPVIQSEDIPGVEKHECFYCQKILRTRPSLNQHLATDHANEGFHCIHCDTFFPVDKEAFEVHVLSHSVKIENDYGLSFTNPFDDSSESSYSSGEEYIPIKRPKKSLPEPKPRAREDTPVGPRKLFVCSYCPKKFKRSLDLKQHEKHEHPAIKEEPEDTESSQEASTEQDKKKDEEEMKEEPETPSSPETVPEPEPSFECPCGREFKSKRALHIHKASKKCPCNTTKEKKKVEEEVLPPRRRTVARQTETVIGTSDSESDDDSSDEDFVKKPRAGPSKEKPLFKCETCGRQFKLKESYNTHVRIHTGEKPFTCHVCGKQFSHSGGLSYHLRHVHYGIKDHKCEFCGRGFALKAALSDHRRIHTGERPYVCDVCGKTFKSKASLYIHSKIHTDSFPHPCKFCNRRFRWRQQLLGHITTHTGEKKHYCATCGKGFGVRNDLTRHERIHSDAKPFSCNLCGVAFGQKRYLKNHIKSRHEGRRQQNAPPPAVPGPSSAHPQPPFQHPPHHLPPPIPHHHPHPHTHPHPHHLPFTHTLSPPPPPQPIPSVPPPLPTHCMPQPLPVAPHHPHIHIHHPHPHHPLYPHHQ